MLWKDSHQKDVPKNVAAESDIDDRTGKDENTNQKNSEKL